MGSVQPAQKPDKMLMAKASPTAQPTYQRELCRTTRKVRVDSNLKGHGIRHRYDRGAANIPSIFPATGMPLLVLRPYLCKTVLGIHLAACETRIKDRSVPPACRPKMRKPCHQATSCVCADNRRCIKHTARCSMFSTSRSTIKTRSPTCCNKCTRLCIRCLAGQVSVLLCTPKGRKYQAVYRLHAFSHHSPFELPQ